MHHGEMTVSPHLKYLIFSIFFIQFDSFLIPFLNILYLYKLQNTNESTPIMLRIFNDFME